MFLRKRPQTPDLDWNEFEETLTPRLINQTRTPYIHSNRRQRSRSIDTMCLLTQSSSASPPSKAKRLAQLCFCAFGICLCYLTYGILQERLYTDASSTDPALILLTQCVTNVLVALIWNGPSGATDIKRLMPHHQLRITSLCYITAMLCSNEAIIYVSYPVIVLSKSCKLIPTMVVGQLVEGRRLYGVSEWLAAAGICCGIVLFQISKLASSDGSNNSSSVRGLVLLSISLTMDGVLSACQNRIKQCSYIPNAAETMLWLNSYAALMLVPYCFIKNHLLRGDVSADNILALLPSTQWMTSLCILNVTVAVGQIFIFLTISWFNSVTTTVITTTRKFLTILVSVLYYGHHFSSTQWVAVVMVFCGLYSCIYQTVAKQDGARPDVSGAKQKQG